MLINKLQKFLPQGVLKKYVKTTTILVTTHLKLLFPIKMKTEC